MQRKLLIGLAVALALVVGGLFVLKPAPVPKAAIASAVVRDAALMERAWQLPVAARYRRVLRFQSNGSFCGPASLANVFRSLDEPNASEASVLEGSGQCSLGFCFMGLSLDALARVAQHHGTRRVTVLRNLTPAGFRDELIRSNDPARRYVINFSRKPIFGGGVGHHSPIAGYLATEDLVFVLDVNREYEPWLIARERMFEAMDTLDGEQKRGLLRVE